MESASPLKAWTDFYVIVGSSAAALTGLMFVVITLVAGLRARTTRDGIATFSTPTVVHFCVVLLIGASVAAPWPALTYVSGFLTVAALVALVYSVRIVARARTVEEYEPDFEDRVSYMILPIVAYSIMLIAAVALAFRPAPALFGLAGTSLLLIFLGIHNAWDVVTYVGVQRLAAEQAEEKATGAAPRSARPPA
ncbi:MAG TPA: hypothetical protein VK669_04895 [Candidatus Limnocylindrales bacterium]|nr:hypothetical protein [Candidatus Limnocylindrales bacterium]